MFNERQKWLIETLATNGGFSDRFIAGQVFNTKPNDLDEKEVRAVTSYRLRIKAKLTDWRNGLTRESKRHVRRATKRPRLKIRRKAG